MSGPEWRAGLADLEPARLERRVRRLAPHQAFRFALTRDAGAEELVVARPRELHRIPLGLLADRFHPLGHLGEGHPIDDPRLIRLLHFGTRFLEGPAGASLPLYSGRLTPIDLNPYSKLSFIS